MKKLILLFAIIGLGLGLQAQVNEKVIGIDISAISTGDTLNVQDVGASSGGGTPSGLYYINTEVGTAVYTSASTLTLSNLPVSIVNDAQLVYIKYVRSGASGYYINGQSGITLTHSAGVVTITGEVGDTLASGDALEVVINGPKITVDYTVEALKFLSLNPLSSHYTSPAVHEGTSQAVTTSWVDLGKVIDMRTYNKGAYWVIVDINDGVDFQVRFLALPNQTATDEYSQLIATVSSTVITVDVEYIELGTDADVLLIYTFQTDNVIPAIQPQIKVGTDPGTDATVTSLVSKAW